MDQEVIPNSRCFRCKTCQVQLFWIFSVKEHSDRIVNQNSLPLAMGDNSPRLPASDSQAGRTRPCFESISGASADLVACLTSANTKYQIDGDHALLHIQKCACYFDFMEVGKECNYQHNSASSSKYAYTLGDETKECAKQFDAWNEQNGEAHWTSWWSSSQGMLSQCIIVVLLLAVLAWCCQDWLRAFFNNDYDEMEALQTEALAEIPRAEVLARTAESKAFQMGSFVQNAVEQAAVEIESSIEDDTNYAEEPQEIQIPEAKRKLHTFQAPRDLGLAPRVPQLNQSLFPPDSCRAISSVEASEVRRVLVSYDLETQA
eukprot:symbB.v1.2.032672.t1/scaffold3952.1/size47578/4